MPLQRLFVGNIPSGTSEQELEQEFSAYGAVSAIDLKSKPNPLTGSVDTFAFVNIELDEQSVRRCINEFRQETYKGVYLNVSKAKESFLDRLKREREEAEASKATNERLNPYRKNEETTKQKQREAEPLPVLPTLKKTAESSSSSESSSESEDEQPAAPVRAVVNRTATKPSEEDQLVRKWNQETYLEHGKLKIVPITGQVKEVIEKGRKRKLQQDAKELSEKARQADEKRKKGLTSLQSSYEQQKQAIKMALAGTGEASGRKKILFDDAEEPDGPPAGKRNKLALFDDEADEGDGFKGNFSVRKQLGDNTEKGQRLFDMQTQFYGDARFKLDERFLADETTDGKKRKSVATDKSVSVKNEGKSNNQERKKQLEILSKVTGRDIQDRSQFKGEEKDKMVMQRYDPSAQSNVSEKAVRKEKVEAEEEEVAQGKQVDRPADDFKVSDEKFYKVSGNIKEMIGSSSGGGFSLLSMFGNADPVDEKEETVEEEDAEKPAFSMARFKYESSASEDEDMKDEATENAEAIIPEPAEENDDGKKKKKKGGRLPKPVNWKENFFFLPGGARLEEGRRFFTEFASSAAEAASVKEDQASHIRKIYKKRKMRETKNMNQIRARRGLKQVKLKLK
ncbi:probable RNA-binding protein CG14230 [Sabethes cyaneus]|uniref:probable RNA-binding protein CG14230 n=1 Tax=Sabethes cyaneus TaxID=53552 RepID=UPI00237E4CAE|nr:probable RNA-binding protein CG14230 [Sabethes cyaneus]